MSLYSTYWYRVAALKPKLRSHIRLYRHSYRGQNWFVLRDPASGRQHRFNTTAYLIIALMDGRKTVDAIWKHAAASLGDDAPTQDEVIQLLARLHGIDALRCDVTPDIIEMFDRQARQDSQWKQRLRNPFALRLPLVDPDRFLSRWVFLVRPMARTGGVLLWLLIVGSAVVCAAINWPELTGDVADRILKPQNLFVLWLVFPVIKLFHELGHAFAIKIWGGEVHEMGIMLLAFTPIPYVEASASASFPDKKRRMGVAAAGMAVELFIAALAMFVWMNVEAGIVHTLAYNVMLIGGVSTVLFNGNPLLRFDGYYILADWLEIPNLAGRSTRYLGYLLKRYLLGMKDEISPVTAPGEVKWFIGYGIAAFFYRIFILAVLVLFVAGKFFFLGTIIALWGLGTQVVIPTMRHGYAVYDSARVYRGKKRFLAGSLAAGAIAVLLLFVIPFPFRTMAEGVVTLEDHSRVRAGADCFIREIHVSDHEEVAKGELLVTCEDPFLASEAQVIEASLREVRARYDAQPLHSRVRRQILKQEMATVQAELQRVRERMNELTIYSPARGLLILPKVDSLPGRFVRQGDILGYIFRASGARATVIVSQADISTVRERTRRVELRLASQPHTSYSTVIQREVPAAKGKLPSPVLGTTGGGKIPVDPSDPEGLRTLTKTFQVELKLPLAKENTRIGERVYAMFDHGHEPLGWQWYRRFRQLFLRRFHI